MEILKYFALFYYFNSLSLMDPTNEKPNNYLLYGNSKGKPKPIGVISELPEIRVTYKKQLPDSLKQNLIAIEDKRFFSHKGIDYKSIARAIYVNLRSFSIKQGGSTITQQLARNLLKDNRKIISRKIKEIQLALDIERTHTKDQILELYFNYVYWGKNLYGIRAASITYFDKEPHHLTKYEKTQLLTLLRGPNLYLRNYLAFQKRVALINEIIEKNSKSRNRCRTKKMAKPMNVKNSLTTFKPSVLKYLNLKVNHSNSSIHTTIEFDLQKMLDFLVNEAKYPTSIVCFYNGQLVGFSSFYGTDYPFSFKSNVGSLLKPFIYTFLRKNGLKKDEQFSTQSDSKWHVREVNSDDKTSMKLYEALKVSNNNVFINASNKIKIDKVIRFIATLTNKTQEKLYPSAILGASHTGMSLFEITKLYHDYFSKSNDTETAECLEILNELLVEKTGSIISNGFFKTGTTNNNRERFSIFGNKIMTVGILRQNYFENDYTKEGNFLGYVREVLRKIISLKRKWFN
ncbi:MAG: penicillin-binding protein [Bacteroidia bacterium]|nr:penicillin-binding protein [Bacteroidia bacterium]